uniref:aralkylamine N-acetyltransferase n=1 Tax=Steinernema glaseri TaxID=37863 RepID=A0A1I7YEH4_9BILA
MATFEEFEFRTATPDDLEAVMEFTNTVFIRQAPVSKTAGLGREESELFYRPAVVKGLQTPYSVLVFHRASGELIGYRIVSVWRREDADNTSVSMDGLPTRLRLLGGVLLSLKNSFWDLCPKEVNCVLRREFSCVRSDFQRKGIASRMANELLDEEELKAKGIGGIVSETSSVANQALLAKKGFKPLLEIFYGSVVDEEGVQVIGDRCVDGSTKIVLNFKSFL